MGHQFGGVVWQGKKHLHWDKYGNEFKPYNVGIIGISGPYDSMTMHNYTYMYADLSHPGSSKSRFC